MTPTILEPIRRDDDIDGFRIRLYFLSRNHGVLFLIATGIIALAMMLAWWLRAPERATGASLSNLAALQQELAADHPVYERIVALMPGAFVQVKPEELGKIAESIGEAHLPTVAGNVVEAYWESLKTGVNDPSAGLLILAYRHGVAPSANEAVGDLHAARRDFERAQASYQREIDLFDSKTARGKLVTLALQQGDYVALRAFSKEPAFAPFFTPHVRLALARKDTAWRDIALALTELELQALKPLPLALALIVGFAWFIIALQAIQPEHWLSFRTIAPPLAVLTGLLSTWPDHFVAVWQEDAFSFHLNGSFLNDLIYYVAIAAPRQEAVKLAFLIPFLPFLLRRRNGLEMLLVSGCVGLGFAIEGNLQSYQNAGASGAFGRLLTSNFFHLASSGLLGQAFCRFLLAPREMGVRLLWTFCCVVLAHGIYDAFISVPGLPLLAIASILSFMTLSLIFFDELRRCRDSATDQLCLSATLLFGLSVLTGAILVCAATQLGFTQAITTLAANAVGLSLVAYVFFRQLGRGLNVETEPLANEG